MLEILLTYGHPGPEIGIFIYIYYYKTNCKNDQNFYKIHLLSFRLNLKSGDRLNILLWTPWLCMQDPIAKSYLTSKFMFQSHDHLNTLVLKYELILNTISIHL